MHVTVIDVSFQTLPPCQAPLNVQKLVEKPFLRNVATVSPSSQQVQEARRVYIWEVTVGSIKSFGFWNSMCTDASSRSKTFLGEGSPQVSTPSRVPISPSSGPITSKLTTALPSAPSPSITPESHFSGIDDSVWSPELQERFRRAPVNIDSPFSNPSGSMSSGVSASGRSPRSLGSDGQADADPITEMVASLSAGASSSDMFNFLQQVRQGTQATSPEVDTLQRDKAIRRIIQLVTAWLLLAYFVFFLEPSVYRSRVGSLDVGRWTRWAVLGENRNMLGLLQTFIVQPQPVSGFLMLVCLFSLFSICG